MALLEKQARKTVFGKRSKSMKNSGWQQASNSKQIESVATKIGHRSAIGIRGSAKKRDRIAANSRPKSTTA